MLALLCQVLLLVVVGQSVPIPKVKEVMYHEPFTLPGLATTVKRNVGSNSIIPLTFTAHNREFLLELEPHHSLIHQEAVFQYEKEGKWYDLQHEKPVYYTGKASVGGKPGTVSLRINHEQDFMTGIIFTDEESFGIEHSSHFYEGIQQFPMVIYKSSDVVQNSSCGVKEQHELPSLMVEAKNMKRQLNTCKISLVADSRFYTALGQNTLDTLERMMDTIASAEVIYRAQSVGGFQVVYLGIYTTQNSDPFYSSATSHTTFLDALITQKSNIPPNNKCLVHAFTYYQWAQGTVGYATIAATCQANGGAGVTSHNSMGHLSTLFSLINTVSHEIGHNHGAQHDTSGNYLMAAVGGANTIQQFSSESLGYFQTTHSQAARTSCFTAAPTSIGFCGNSYLDAGEQCDCGTASACATDIYCNSTCKLKAGYVCSPKNGVCCTNSGTLVPAGTVCDVAPYNGIPAPTCTGTSPVCPDCFPDKVIHPCNMFSNTAPCFLSTCKVGCYIDGGSVCIPGPNFNPPLASNLPDGACCTGGKCLNGVCVPTNSSPSSSGTLPKTSQQVNQQTSKPTSVKTSQQIIIPPTESGVNQQVEKSGGSSKTPLVFGIVIALVIFAVVILALVCCVIFRRKKKSPRPTTPIQHVVISSTPPAPVSSVNNSLVGRMCLAVYMGDGKMYRAQIIEETNEQLLVQYVDYGERGWVFRHQVTF